MTLMAEIILKSGEIVLVDEADFAWLSKRKWAAAKSWGGIYAKCGQPYAGHTRMHRAIMNAPAGMVVDHINGNTLDNRRENLRVCTHQQNMCNRKDNANRRVSKYRGVIYQGPASWYAYLTHMGKRLRTGPHRTEIEAAAAFDKLAIELRGSPLP